MSITKYRARINSREYEIKKYNLSSENIIIEHLDGTIETYYPPNLMGSNIRDLIGRDFIDRDGGFLLLNLDKLVLNKSTNYWGGSRDKRDVLNNCKSKDVVEQFDNIIDSIDI